MTDTNELITEHLDIWTSAVGRKSGAGRGKSGKISLYGIKKLRELILELAVQGKLVPQLLDEGKASSLVAEYATNKRAWIKEKRVRNQKVQTKLADEEKPAELPQSWEWVRIGDLGFIFNGNSVSTRDKSDKYGSPHGLPFIATKDVGYGFEAIDYSGGTWIPEGEAKFKVAPKGTTLICSEGGSAGKKCGITDRSVCFGNKLFACLHYGEYVPEFLLAYYQTPMFYAEFSIRMTGIIGGISQGSFVNLPCPLPPLSEQHRIMAKVDELMELCDELEQQAEDSLKAHQTLVDTLLATLTNSQSQEELAQNWARIESNFDVLLSTESSISAFFETILELGVSGRLTNLDGMGKTEVIPDLLTPIPSSWEVCSLSELLKFGPKNGFSPRAVDHETLVKSLTLTATTSGKFDGSHFKYVDIETPKEESELWLKNGDILVQRGNALQYVGVAAIYDGQDNKFIYPDLMIKFRLNERIDRYFALLVLQSPSTRTYFRNNATGTSGSMPKINHKVLLNAKIPLPPIEEQREIVAIVRELFSLSEALLRKQKSVNQKTANLADALTTRQNALKKTCA